MPAARRPSPRRGSSARTCRSSSTPNVDTWFPFTKGWKATYRWTNTRHLARPVVERYHVDAAAATSPRARSSGPIEAEGNYRYLDDGRRAGELLGDDALGLAADAPGLGPKAAPPAKRRRFATPFDLMDFGFNPLLPAYPTGKDVWTCLGHGPGLQDVRRQRHRARARPGEGDDAGGDVQLPRRQEHAEAAGLPVRQRHAHELVRCRRGARQARVPPRRRQRLGRRAHQVAR